MKVAQKHILLVSLFFVICLACKKETPGNSGFELSATTESNTVVLNWTPVLLSGFKSINIYRSASPIPDPQFNRPIDPTLLIGTISDRIITSFRDSNMVLGSSGQVYYKIVLNLDNRIIPSNEEQVSLDGFSVKFNTPGSSSSGGVYIFPEKNLIYIIRNSAGTINVVDYSQKKLLKTAFFTQWGNIFPVLNGGNAEFFMMNNNSQISCYDGLTCMSKYSITIPNGNVSDFKVQDNYMYVLSVYNYSATIRTYDLSTQLMVNQRNVYNSSNGFYCNLYIGTQSNSLFFKYYSQIYSSLTGYYVNKSIFVKYNLVNHLPADSVVISHPLMNKDSLSGSYSYYSVVKPSPDGNYITCNYDGDILSMSDNSIHNIKTGNFLNPNVIYSNSGNYLLSKSNNSNINLMDIFSLPNFSLVKTLKSPNPAFNQGSGSMVKDDFLDNDSLVSYNFKHTFSNNQTSSVFTVFFTKLN